MNFDFSDDQQAIKRTARDLLAQRFKPDVVRELAEATRYDDSHWTELAELGWPGIFIAEEIQERLFLVFRRLKNTFWQATDGHLMVRQCLCLRHSKGISQKRKAGLAARLVTSPL